MYMLYEGLHNQVLPSRTAVRARPEDNVHMLGVELVPRHGRCCH